MSDNDPLVVLHHDGKCDSYPFVDVVTCMMYGLLCRNYSFSDMAYFLKQFEGDLTGPLRLENGTPSCEVLLAVLRLFEEGVCLRCFRACMLDACRQDAGVAGRLVLPYVIAADYEGVSFTIAEVPGDGQVDEVVQVLRLLGMLSLDGGIVSVDGIGIREPVMDLIMGRQGDFCQQLDASHAELFSAIDAYIAGHVSFDGEYEWVDDYLDEYETWTEKGDTFDKESFRIVKDEKDVKELVPEGWGRVVCLGKYVHERTDAGTTTTETRYHVMSRLMSADEYAELIRRPQRIGGNGSWVVDITYDKAGPSSDLAARTKAIRKAAFEMTRLLPELDKLTNPLRESLFMHRPEVAAKLFYEVLPASMLPDEDRV